MPSEKDFTETRDKEILVDEKMRPIIALSQKEKEKAQVGDIKEILKDVSKRTLRRDFDDLLKQHLVERIGHSNDTYYVLVKD